MRVLLAGLARTFEWCAGEGIDRPKVDFRAEDPLPGRSSSR
jgi:hypothetical protein